MDKDIFKDLKSKLMKMLEEREVEIAETNEYLQRDDIPVWKSNTMRERKDFLVAQVEVIKEIQEKIKEIK